LSAGELAVSVTRSGRHAAVELEGELDVATAEQLGRVLEGLRGAVDIDVRKLTFIDSAGALVIARAADDVRRVRIRHASRITRLVLTICNLGDCVVDSPRDASRHGRRRALLTCASRGTDAAHVRCRGRRTPTA
jgi:anti-anti-sigma factor